MSPQPTTDGNVAVKQPRLSIVAVFYNMAREAPRTLYSLSAAYQRGVTQDDYEVIAIDNGSSIAMTEDQVRCFGDNMRLCSIDNAPPSPAYAINHGVRLSNAEFVGVLIDGARISSPGMVRAALDALEAFQKPFVTTVGFHLGPDMQTRSPALGYSKDVEDQLLETIDWKNNGYRMFSRSALAGSSRNGWLGSLAESNLFFMPRSSYDDIGGYDERFDLPGGGFVNLDFYKQACELADSQLITLLGEATFHQIHGGIMTNRPEEKLSAELDKYRKQYLAIRGQDFRPTQRAPLLFGFVNPEMKKWLAATDAADRALPAQKSASPRPKYSEQEVALARKSARGNSVIGRAENAPEQKDHRSFVGPNDYYDKVAALQFSVLTMLGMREHHKLLDIGCGSLRGGRLFMPYLAKHNYHGLEPNPWLIEQAVEHEIGADLIAIKAPKFEHNDSFDLSVFGQKFDYMMAHSIFSHTSHTQFDTCLANVALTLADSGVLVATFVESKKDRYKDEWEYPGFNHFCWPTLQGLFAKHGLYGSKLDWPHPLQTWFAVTRKSQRIAQIAEDGIDLLPNDLILTGPRFMERSAGRFLNFYRNV